MQCFPFESLWLALGSPVIDYFSLDVEGSEMSILETIPWDKGIQIKAWTVEYNTGIEKAVTKFLLAKGYVLKSQIDNVDLLFVKPE